MPVVCAYSAGHDKLEAKLERGTMVKQQSKCAVSQQCGACVAIDTPYEVQLEQKQAQMIELFKDIADEDCALHPICGMDEPFYYRNKVVSPFAPGARIKRDTRGGAGADAGGKKGRGKDRKGDSRAKGKRGQNSREILCGMYAKGTHRIIDSSCCLLENEEAKRIIQTIKQLMPKFGIEPYNEDTGAGFLRHAIVRVGHSSGEILVTLVTNGSRFPASKAFCRELCKRVPSITTVVQNVNTRFTNVILGDEGETRLYGPGFILDDLCGLRFRISSHSFYQVNVTQTEVLYRRAIELAGLSGNEVVMDAYCGTGTIGLVAARGIEGAGASDGTSDEASSGTTKGAVADAGASSEASEGSNTAAEANTGTDAITDTGATDVDASADAETPATSCIGAAKVIGVDKVADAIKDARNNARHNKIENAEFFAEDAGRFMQRYAREGGHIDVLFMDPPRAGSSKEFLDATCELKPERIVYISCGPNTQARDVAYLVERGYKLTDIQPVDMFPHTTHTENICRLELRK